jgi:hypothetical protein
MRTFVTPNTYIAQPITTTYLVHEKQRYDTFMVQVEQSTSSEYELSMVMFCDSMSTSAGTL